MDNLLFLLVWFLEAIRWVSRPGDHINLVQNGVDNTNVKLEWMWDLEGETFRDVAFERHRPGELRATQIAWRSKNFAFTVLDQFVNEYDARLPATLILRNVDNDEEYIYTIALSYLSPSNISLSLQDQVTVVVHGKKGISAPYKSCYCFLFWLICLGTWPSTIARSKSITKSPSFDRYYYRHFLIVLNRLKSFIFNLNDLTTSRETNNSIICSVCAKKKEHRILCSKWKSDNCIFSFAFSSAMPCHYTLCST